MTSTQCTYIISKLGCEDHFLLKIANGHVIQRVTHILIVERVTTVMMENANWTVSFHRTRSLILFYIEKSDKHAVLSIW